MFSRGCVNFRMIFDKSKNNFTKASTLTPYISIPYDLRFFMINRCAFVLRFNQVIFSISVVRMYNCLSVNKRMTITIVNTCFQCYQNHATFHEASQLLYCLLLIYDWIFQTLVYYHIVYNSSLASLAIVFVSSLQLNFAEIRSDNTAKTKTTHSGTSRHTDFLHSVSKILAFTNRIQFDIFYGIDRYFMVSNYATEMFDYFIIIFSILSQSDLSFLFF